MVIQSAVVLIISGRVEANAAGWCRVVANTAIKTGITALPLSSTADSGVLGANSPLPGVPPTALRNQPAPPGCRQPIEVAALADACARAFAMTADDRWRSGVRMAWAWFLGDNDTCIPMLDPHTGGGFAGLHARAATSIRAPSPPWGTVDRATSPTTGLLGDSPAARRRSARPWAWIDELLDAMIPEAP